MMSDLLYIAGTGSRCTQDTSKRVVMPTPNISGSAGKSFRRAVSELDPKQAEAILVRVFLDVSSAAHYFMCCWILYAPILMCVHAEPG